MRRVASAAVLLVGVSVSSLGLTAAPAVASSIVTRFNDPDIGDANHIVSGPDGALWFTSGNVVSNSVIGRITTTGVVTTFTDPALYGPDALAVGPDGALWFSNAGDLSIGRMTTAGSFSYFHDDNIQGVTGIAAGSDGALWFTDWNDSSIGRITTTGTVTNFTGPDIGNPGGIAAGPDGALWFANTALASVGRITTTGTVTKYTGPGVLNPQHIVAGPDGNLWFTNDGSIGRVTTTGAVTTFPVAAFRSTGGIAAGPDGAVWFTHAFVRPRAIGRITTTGTVALVTDPDIVGPSGITAGPDGAVWFTDAGAIARITTATVVSPGAATVVEGNSGTATIEVPITLNIPSTQTVTAQWSTVVVPNGAVKQADPGTDYTAASGTVTFMPGETAHTATINVNGDTLGEPDEYIVVRVTNPTHAGLGGLYGLGIGFGFITDDDRPTVVPGLATIVEGDSGTANLQVPVTLSHASNETVTVHWATAPGANVATRADPVSDFTAASGTVTFAPGDTAKTVTISVNGDENVESDEWIIVPFNNPTNAKMGGFYGLGFGGITNDD